MELSMWIVLLLACWSAAAFDGQDYLYDENAAWMPPVLRWNDSFPAPEAAKKFGQVSGVFAVNASHVYVFHRADRRWEADDFDAQHVFQRKDHGPIKRPTIALLVDGHVVREFGEGLFFMPHSISVDAQGNLWTTDTALHQVFKFHPDDLSRPALVLGERFQPGNDERHFCQPTDVKIARDGEFFVSDGYCNSRILHFHANGSFIDSWGHDHLGLPHGLALNEAEDTLLVADRQHKRVTGFSAGLRGEPCGQFVAHWPMEEQVYAVAYSPQSDEIYALVGETFGSYVSVVDFSSGATLGWISGWDQHRGFGLGHAISGLGDTQPGFVVGSIYPDCPAIGFISCASADVFDERPPRGALYLYNAATAATAPAV